MKYEFGNNGCNQSRRNIDKIEIGGRIREWRQQHNWTIKELAERCGVSGALVSLVERGKAQSFPFLVAILKDGFTL